MIFVCESRVQVVWIIFHFCDFWSIFAWFFIHEFQGVFLRFLPCIWVLGWGLSSTSNIGVNPCLYPLRFHWFLLVPQKPRFLSSSKVGKGNHWIWKKPLLRTCSLCWGDPCVQVLFDLEHYSSRIKLGKKGADFGRKSRFSETSYRTMPSPTGQCPTWPR
jgi:hypothetical protein